MSAERLAAQDQGMWRTAEWHDVAVRWGWRAETQLANATLERIGAKATAAADEGQRGGP
jgi:hypothetical protein